MTSTAEIKSQIQGAIEQIQEAMGAVGGAQSQADAAIGAGTAATQDTGSPLPGEALAQWQQAKEQLDEALSLFQGGVDAFEQYAEGI
ncbi:hypothetical protein K3N28_21525 [Glycomyces sp. TRM65418]|uniref:hypothetical protein n=1 Tax=Glycomyces sp. TRM65418 TaxID=2867006 RepID=UPI001CE5B331|nr:hypothetical protein [Glycomyces sp. TRM65418]MCC3765644.1 hypothetical protein [Glycomyces sp. TRM65418]QZD55242.1 hypothetical protein K3N28_21415 [Glycomyces sp. TRM65418]